MSNPALQLNNITRVFTQGGRTLEVLKGVDLTINAGEMVALVGPSGSGKTTLLQIAGLLDTPTHGKVIIDGVECSNARDALRTSMRLNKMGFVYQFHHLLPEFSALENIVLPQLIAGEKKPKAKEQARRLLAEMGLLERESHRPAKLSGGEQQRVAIARALANNPVLLLADEPTGNLDHHTAEEVFTVLKNVVKEKKLAALIATHNMDLAKRMDRIITLQDGIIS